MRRAMTKSTIAFPRPDDFRGAASFCHSFGFVSDSSDFAQGCARENGA